MEKTESSKLLSKEESNNSTLKNNNDDGEDKTTSRILLGILIVMLSNVFTLSTDYSVKLLNLQYAELYFIVGTSSTLIYGAILIYQGGFVNLLPGGIEKWRDHVGLTVAFALISGLGVVVSIAAVKLLPMGDLVVLKFSSPIPTYFWTVCILKGDHYWSKMALCLFLLLGDILVVQPPMIFANGKEDNGVWPHYWLGVSIAVLTAISIAVNSVLTKKLQQAASPSFFHYLFHNLGPSVIVYSIAIHFMSFHNRFIFSGNEVRLQWREIGYLLGTALLMHLKFITLIGGITLASPMLAVSVRNLEILMVLSIEIFAFGNIPDLMTSFGIFLVLASVFGLAFHGKFTREVFVGDTNKK